MEGKTDNSNRNFRRLKGSLVFTIDSPEYEFYNSDCGSFLDEIKEFYSREDLLSFADNYSVFIEEASKFGFTEWKNATNVQKSNVICNFLDKFEVKNEEMMIRACQGLLYLLQGCWVEADTYEDLEKLMRNNAILLYNWEVFHKCYYWLCDEIDLINEVKSENNFDKQRLKFNIILSILYTITEVIRNEISVNNCEFLRELRAFRLDLLQHHSYDFISQTILNMMFMYCHNKAPFFPIKKILLLCWKLIVVQIGSNAERKIHRVYRRDFYRQPTYDESIDVSLKMRCKSLQSNDFNFVYGSIPPSFQSWWKPKITEDVISCYAKMYFKGKKQHPDSQFLCKNRYITLESIFKKNEDRESSINLYWGTEFDPTEIFYRTVVPSFSKYLTCFLRLVVSATMSKVPIKCPSISKDIDSVRDKEIVLKSISAVLIMLLKWFRLNHCYQFEYMTQELVARKCIQIILNFLRSNQNFVRQVREEIEFFPCNFVRNNVEMPELKVISERNLFTLTNFLRILHKITKNRQRRIIILVEKKSFTILKPLLEIAHSTIRLYILKLLKGQFRFFDRKWYMENIDIVTAVTRLVRKVPFEYKYKTFNIKEEKKEDEKLNIILRRYNQKYIDMRGQTIYDTLKFVLNDLNDKPDYGKNSFIL